jgi:thiol:disulfide interchange protein DsbD
MLSTFRFFLFAFAISLGHSAFGLAENSPLASNPFETQEEAFLHVDEAYILSARQTDTHIILEWMITEKYFLYGEQFRFLIDGKPVEATRPEGKIAYDEIFEKDVEKYYIYTTATIDKTQIDRTATEHKLSATYQGCADAGLCYPPETKHFTITVDAITSTSQANATSTINTSTAPEYSDWATLIIALFSALIGGVILNLMPCVFPVLSIKALSLINHTDPSSRIKHGWSYTAGTLFTFVAIASLLLAIRNAGQSIGWGFQLQEPAVITVLAFLFFIMGLSLSGLIQFGARWMGVGQSLTQGKQLSHSFFTGVLAAVVASPCTAPFMASALGYALTQSTVVALGVFAALGFGMALPFLLLSHIPKLSRFLPQPGAWMDTFKQALAFPLYITSVWLLWVLGHQIGSNGMALVILGAIGIIFSFWLSQKLNKGRSIIHALCLLLIISIVWHNKQKETLSSHPATAFWQPYSQEKLNTLRQQGEAVFVNLTADWCITCKINEKIVFTPNTLKIMQDKGIHLLEGDWTNYNPEITHLLDEYRRGGVPLYLLFPAKPNAEAKILPQILTPSALKTLISGI